MKTEEDEEVIEMGEEAPGKFYPVAVRKVPIPMSVRHPRGYKFYEFLGGVSAGLDVLERFFDIMGRNVPPHRRIRRR